MKFWKLILFLLGFLVAAGTPFLPKAEIFAVPALILAGTLFGFALKFYLRGNEKWPLVAGTLLAWIPLAMMPFAPFPNDGVSTDLPDTHIGDLLHTQFWACILFFIFMLAGTHFAFFKKKSGGAFGNAIFIANFLIGVPAFAFVADNCMDFLNTAYAHYSFERGEATILASCAIIAGTTFYLLIFHLIFWRKNWVLRIFLTLVSLAISFVAGILTVTEIDRYYIGKTISNENDRVISHDPNWNATEIPYFLLNFRQLEEDLEKKYSGSTPKAAERYDTFFRVWIERNDNYYGSQFPLQYRFHYHIFKPDDDWSYAAEFDNVSREVEDFVHAELEKLRSRKWSEVLDESPEDLQLIFAEKILPTTFPLCEDDLVSLRKIAGTQNPKLKRALMKNRRLKRCWSGCRTNFLGKSDKILIRDIFANDADAEVRAWANALVAPQLKPSRERE